MNASPKNQSSREESVITIVIEYSGQNEEFREPLVRSAYIPYDHEEAVTIGAAEAIRLSRATRGIGGARC